MKRNFEENDYIEFDNKKYKVEGIAGEGANSTVYYARNIKDNVLYILKEYNPKNIPLTRNELGIFDLSVLNENDLRKFNEGKKRFVNAAEKQRDIRNQYKDMTNNTSIVNDIFDDECMAYVDISVFSGKSYDKVEMETNLRELLIRLEAILRAVKAYHNNGFLHLDIKPANIFILDNSNDFVMLFDFDSVIERRELYDCDIRISYSENWAAPEQCNYQYRSLVSERTDIFSIGEILFYKLFSRHSYMYERRSFSKYDYDLSPICQNINPQVLDCLTNIFRKAIVVNPKKRFDNCDDFIKEIDKALEILEKGDPYLKPFSFVTSNRFVGRNKQIDELDDLLSNNRIVIVNGIGGIGKTEFIKRYALLHNNIYDHIIYAAQDSSVENLVTHSLANNIINNDITDELEDSKFEKTIQALNIILSERDLVILDNVNSDFFDQKYSRQTKKLLGLNCKFIIGSRYITDLYPNISLKELDKAELRDLFCYWYNEKTDDFASVDELIRLASYHTLTVELIAKQCARNFMSPQEDVVYLNTHGFEADETIVVSDKDMSETRNSIFGHINTLYNLANLSDEECYLLQCINLAPITGVQGKLLSKLVDSKYINLLGELKNGGWIDSSEGKLSIHPIISMVIQCNRPVDFKIDNILGKFYEYYYCQENLMDRENYEFYFSVCEKLAGKYASFSYLRFINMAFRYQYITSYDKENFISLFEVVFNELWKGGDHSEELYEELLNFTSALANEGNENAQRFLDYATSFFDLFNYSIEFKAEILYIRAALEFYKSNYDIACDCYKEIIGLYSELSKNGDDFRREVANSTYNLAFIYLKTGDFDLSEKNYKKSIEMYMDLGDEESDDVLDCYDGLAELYCRTNRYDLAKEYIDLAYEISTRKYGQEADISSRIHCTMAEILISENEVDSAIKILELELDYSKKTLSKDDRQLGGVYSVFMKAYIQKGLYDEAIKYMNLSNDIYRKLKFIDWYLIGDNYFEIGKCLRKAEMIYESEKNLMLAIDAYTHDENNLSCEKLRDVYMVLGYIEKNRDMEKAHGYFVKSLKIAESEIKRNNEIIQTLLNEIAFTS